MTGARAGQSTGMAEDPEQLAVALEREADQMERRSEELRRRVKAVRREHSDNPEPGEREADPSSDSGEAGAAAGA